MPDVYLSPSTQDYNPYIIGGSEKHYMNLLADAMEPYLSSSGISYGRNDPNGNAAAAVAAYAAKADMECFIMLPPGAVKERAWQNMAYGGHFIYGLGGVLVPFVGIKLIDLLISVFF